MFNHDALLLVGHGSSNKKDAASPLLAHAAAIRESGVFAEVAAGTLAGEPDMVTAFDNLTAPVVHVVPFFLEDGYFTRIAIPDRLLPRVSQSRVIRFYPPVGSHDGFAALLAARLARHCEMFGIEFRSLSVILAGHGSSRNPGRTRRLRQHAKLIEGLGRYGWVRTAFLEESPFLSETLAAERGHVVAVIGYLANEGMHATVQLPELIAAERALRGTNWPPVHDLGCIGGDAILPRMITDLVTRTI